MKNLAAASSLVAEQSTLLLITASWQRTSWSNLYDVDLFIVRLLAHQALSDSSLYKSDHAYIIQICTTPFSIHTREPSRCDESSCLRMLLDKRDAWLGPWTPGRFNLY